MRLINQIYKVLNVKQIKYGKWLMEDIGHVELWAVCSECGHSNFSKSDIEGGYLDGNYCPNCGAKMNKE